MSKTINISLPEELLREIDEFAKSEYASRSDFIRETLVRRIRGQRVVDEWGDPAGEWSDTVDLRDKRGRGISAEEVVAIIEEITGGSSQHDRQTKKISR